MLSLFLLNYIIYRVIILYSIFRVTPTVILNEILSESLRKIYIDNRVVLCYNKSLKELVLCLLSIKSTLLQR